MLKIRNLILAMKTKKEDFFFSSKRENYPKFLLDFDTMKKKTKFINYSYSKNREIIRKYINKMLKKKKIRKLNQILKICNP